MDLIFEWILMTSQLWQSNPGEVLLCKNNFWFFMSRNNIWISLSHRPLFLVSLVLSSQNPWPLPLIRTDIYGRSFILLHSSEILKSSTYLFNGNGKWPVHKLCHTLRKGRMSRILWQLNGILSDLKCCKKRKKNRISSLRTKYDHENHENGNEFVKKI